MAKPAFRRFMLTLCAGPLIWMAHFLIIYITTALACARNLATLHWGELNLLALCILLLTLIALALIVYLHTPGRLHRVFREVQPPATQAFFQWTAMAFAVLSGVAICWETLPVFFLNYCS